MGKPNFSEDFKRGAVHRITVRGYPVREVSERLGVSTYSLYKWMQLYAKAASQASSVDHEDENRRLKRELARKTEERDILKKSGRVLRKGCKVTYAFSRDRAAFLRAHNIEHSMSRRGNCHDNAVAESFFNLLKRARIRRRTYKTREQARQHILDDIEMFYNPKRTHARNAMLSPVDFENRQRNVNQEGVYENRGYSPFICCMSSSRCSFVY